MTTYYLINAVRLADSSYAPGTMVNTDAGDSVSAIQAAGGLLAPTSNATVATAAALATALKLQGSSDAAAESVMMAAYDAFLRDEVASAGASWSRSGTEVAVRNAGDAVNLGTGSVKHGADPASSGDMRFTQGDVMRWKHENPTPPAAALATSYGIRATHLDWPPSAVVDQVAVLGHNIVSPAGTQEDVTRCSSWVQHEHYYDDGMGHLFEEWHFNACGPAGAAIRRVIGCYYRQDGFGQTNIAGLAKMVDEVSGLEYVKFFNGTLLIGGAAHVELDNGCFIHQSDNNAAVITGVTALGATVELARVDALGNWWLSWNAPIRIGGNGPPGSACGTGGVRCNSDFAGFYQRNHGLGADLNVWHYDANDWLWLGSTSAPYTLVDAGSAIYLRLGNANKIIIGADAFDCYLPMTPLRVTSAQRAALAPVTEGEFVYDTDLKLYCFWNGAAWRKIPDAAI